MERKYGYTITHPRFIISNTTNKDDDGDDGNNNNTTTFQPPQFSEERWKILSGQIRNLERIKNHQNHTIQMDTNATWTRHQKTFYRYYESNNNNTYNNTQEHHNEQYGKSITAEEYERRYYTHVIHKNNNNSNHHHSNPWALYFASLKEHHDEEQHYTPPQKSTAVPENNDAFPNGRVPTIHPLHELLIVNIENTPDGTEAGEQEIFAVKSLSDNEKAIVPEILQDESSSSSLTTTTPETSLSSSSSSTLPISTSMVSLPDRDEPSQHPALAAAEQRLWKAMDAALAEYSATVLEIQQQQRRREGIASPL
jgi:hypothetical protein